MTDDRDFTAILNQWSIIDTGKQYVCGQIEDDKKGRFPDGHFVRTSYVTDNKPIGELVEGDIIQTRNSRYKLGKPYELPAEEVA